MLPSPHSPLPSLFSCFVGRYHHNGRPEGSREKRDGGGGACSGGFYQLLLLGGCTGADRDSLFLLSRLPSSRSRPLSPVLVEPMTTVPGREMTTRREGRLPPLSAEQPWICSRWAVDVFMEGGWHVLFFLISCCAPGFGRRKGGHTISDNILMLPPVPPNKPKSQLFSPTFRPSFPRLWGAKFPGLEC